VNPLLDQVIALVATVGLLGYLVYVLLKPEQF
jgi:K+-transporting ATPase KdpF subunit